MFFLETISVAIVAWVFNTVLIAEGMVFGWYGDWLHKLNNTRPWLAKPLGYCLACFAGQLGFWWYLIAYRGEWILGQHIIFTCQTIFFALLISKLNARIET
jgi:hypothetical protein